MNKKKNNNATDNNTTDNVNQNLKEYIAKCECEYKAAIKSWSCKAILDAWTRLKCARTAYHEQMNIKDKRESTNENSS